MEVDENTDNIMLNGTASFDPDAELGDSISEYRWIQVNEEGEEIVNSAIELENADTATPTFTSPSVEEDIELRFSLTVKDSKDETSNADTVTVNVRNVNIIPTAVITSETAEQTIFEDSRVPVILNGSASSDEDGSIVSYVWTQTDGPSVTLENNDTATPTFTVPQVEEDTLLRFSLTVADNDGATSDNEAISSVLVKNIQSSINNAPVADAGEDKTVNEGTVNVLLNGSASFDVDVESGDSITAYEWTQTAGLPVTIENGNSAQTTFSAPMIDTQNTTLTFSLAVTDTKGEIGTDTVSVLVTNVNQAPVADAGQNQTVSEGEANVLLNGSASNDSDNDSLNYSWTQLSGSTVTLHNANNAQATFSAPLIDKASETLTFSLTVEDSEGIIDTAFTSINVRNVNQPPVANAGADQTVDENTGIELNGASSFDPDTNGQVTSYTWTQTAGPAVILHNANTATPAFTSPSVEADTILKFSLSVQDNEGSTSNTATTNVMVKNLVNNIAPIASATILSSTPVIGSGSTVTLDGSTSFDPDGGSITTYKWAQTTGTPVTLTGTNTVKATFKAPAYKTDTALTFQLIVVDDDTPTPLQGSTTANVVVASHPGTIGYWKTHQKETTALLPVVLGSYKADIWTKAYNVLNKATASNAYDMLAAQLLATKLDIKNGSPVCTAITDYARQADSMLNSPTYKGPGTANAPSSTVKTAVTSLSGKLDTYNNYGCMGLYNGNTVTTSSTTTLPNTMTTVQMPSSIDNSTYSSPANTVSPKHEQTQKEQQTLPGSQDLNNLYQQQQQQQQKQRQLYQNTPPLAIAYPQYLTVY